MKKIISITLSFALAFVFVLLTSCNKEQPATQKSTQTAKSRVTPIEQVPGKAINKAQNAYDSANKELEKALQ